MEIVAEAGRRGLELPRVYGGSVAIPGKAVKARLGSGFVTVGSPRHAAGQAAIPPDLQDRIAALEAEGRTVVAVCEARRLIGLIALRDQPRADAGAALDRLRAIGVRPVMLTGDNARTAAAIAGDARARLPAPNCCPRPSSTPSRRCGPTAPVAMVGDGINDAPALAAASVGIAMGGGTDVALETADAGLLGNRVSGVAELIALSRATRRNIWQNVALALGLKGLLLVTSLAGVTSLWMAILADTGATVLVTANALRLLRFRP